MKLQHQTDAGSPRSGPPRSGPQPPPAAAPAHSANSSSSEPTTHVYPANVSEETKGTNVIYEISLPPPTMVATEQSVSSNQSAMTPTPERQQPKLSCSLPPPAERVPSINCTEDFLGHQEAQKSGDGPETAHMLFWTVVHVQKEVILALADTGSCRNLMSEDFWKSLNLNVPLSPPGLTRVLAGDGLPLNLR